MGAEPGGWQHSHGGSSSSGTAPFQWEQKGCEGCAPQQHSCPCSCSQHSSSQQLSMARLDTGGRQGQTPFVQLIPDILIYMCTPKRGSVRAQLIRAETTPGMKWQNHGGSWHLRHRSELHSCRNVCILFSSPAHS